MVYTFRVEICYIFVDQLFICSFMKDYQKQRRSNLRRNIPDTNFLCFVKNQRVRIIKETITRQSTFYLLICVTHILPVIASYFRFNSLHSNAGKLLNPSIPVNNKANIKYRRIRKQIQYYGIASFERLCRKTVSLLDLARLTLFCFWFNALHENEIDCGIKLKLPPGPLVAPKFLSSNFFVDLWLLFSFFRLHLQLILQGIFKQQRKTWSTTEPAAWLLSVASPNSAEDVEESFSVGTEDNTPTKPVLTPYLCHSRFPRNQISLFDITPRPTCFKNSTNGFARKFDTIIQDSVKKNPNILAMAIS